MLTSNAGRERIAGGDRGSLIAISGNNETTRLLQALQDMNDSMRITVGQLRGGAAKLGAIAAGNLDLAARSWR